VSLSTNRLAFIEVGRGIAAIFVVCYHATGTVGATKYFGSIPLGGVFSFGYAGVDFFFVLSGFIIFYSTEKKHGNNSAILSYLTQRLVRIYPIYWFVGLLLLPLAFMWGHHISAANATMDLLLIPRPGSPFVPVAWTLSHEMLFYLSFILFFINPTFAWVYFLSWGMGVALYNLLDIDASSNFLRFYFRDHNLEFLLGLLVAKLSGRGGLVLIMAPRVALFGAFAFVGIGLNEALVNVGVSSRNTHYHLLYGICAALMICGLIHIRSNESCFWTRWGGFFGKASYSIYLVHFSVLSGVIKLLVLLGVSTWLAFILLVVVAVLAGSLLYKYVEAPLLFSIRKRICRRNYAHSIIVPQRPD
jgi:exopolysaccharide production protein ExoZ